MRVLVTGGKGAIGTRLIQRIAEIGHEPFSYDKLDGQNIFDLMRLEAAIRDADVVYHAAAESNLNNMCNLDGGYNGTLCNVGATHNVAHLCSKHHKWLLFLSTLCVYGNCTDLPQREDMTLPEPSEIYAASKYAAEWIIRGYGKSLNLPYTILRVATVFGPGCRAELGVHVFFRQALKGDPITVHGDGSQVRTLTYIDDAVAGILAPLGHASEAMGQVFNISGREAISAIDMAMRIKQLTGSNSKIVFVPQRKHNIQTEDADVSKARRLLQWEAQISLIEGLNRTFSWLTASS